MMGSDLKLAKTNDCCAGQEPELTVVMIHGIASNSGTYDETIKYLTKKKSLQNVRFVTFDLLGAGKSVTDDDLNYDFKDQLTAIHNSIQKLDVKTPLVLIGHSMGTMIVTRYAHDYKDAVTGLILISPPIFTREDLKDPIMQMAMGAFKGRIDPSVRDTKAFNNEVDLILLNPDNYDRLMETALPTTIIYGNKDSLIASFNIPGLIKKNKNIRVIEVDSGHSVSEDKYVEVGKILEEISHA